MNYFNGFLMKGEETLFENLLVKGECIAAGFSMGAIKALEFAIEQKRRVDRLILLSPAFFHSTDKEFADRQISAWNRSADTYSSVFLKNCAYPSNLDLRPMLSDGSSDELRYLLEYRWDPEKISRLISRGVVVEVFLGSQDRIIDARQALEFFENAGAICYLFKEAGHILQPIFKKRRNE